jgi:ribonuclease HII
MATVVNTHWVGWSRRRGSVGWICGIDEAGRGPIAGPVTAAAVILPDDFPREILDDSKVLSPEQRQEAAAVIRDRAVCWALGWATHVEIDEINILRATLLAMSRAVGSLAVRPDRLVVDGLYCPSCGIPATAIVRGDATVPEIMAASILAKTARDAWMEEYSKTEPAYCFERHKGYPTPEHRRLVLELGPSAIQRLTFRVSAPLCRPPRPGTPPGTTRDLL